MDRNVDTRYPRVLAENQPQFGKIFLQKANIDLIRGPGISLLFSTPKKRTQSVENALVLQKINTKVLLASEEVGSW